MSRAELDRELSKLSVEHGDGRNKSAAKQEQLEGWSIEFLNQLRRHQVKQLIANRMEEIVMMLNLRKVESAIAINESPPKRGRKSTPRASKGSRDESESSSGTEDSDESAAESRVQALASVRKSEEPNRAMFVLNPRPRDVVHSSCPHCGVSL